MAGVRAVELAILALIVGDVCLSAVQYGAVTVGPEAAQAIAAVHGTVLIVFRCVGGVSTAAHGGCPVR